MKKLPKDWFAQTEFDCVSAEGKKFRAIARIGRPYRTPKRGEIAGCSHCPVDLEPIATRWEGVGEDHFTALCYGLDIIRRVLRTFIAYGGKVYFADTTSLIDVESPTFTPMLQPADFIRSWEREKKNSRTSRSRERRLRRRL